MFKPVQCQRSVTETNMALHVTIWIGFSQLMAVLYSSGLNISVHRSDMR